VRRRFAIFAVIVVVCCAAATLAVVTAAGDAGGGSVNAEDAASAAAQLAPATAPAETAATDPSAAAAGAGTLVFRSLQRADGSEYGRLAFAPLDDLEHRTVTDLRCERVYFAAGHGICIAVGSLPGTWDAILLGPDLQSVGRVRVGGVPSRARVSPDGRYGATTVFVTGHSYASTGAFSTETLIIDLATGESLGNLEQWKVDKDGKTVDAPDVNFWGVTFSPQDSDRFYATLATGGKTYLIEGSVSGRTARVIHENVECPSISPDGTRIAYKKLMPGGVGQWRFHVLDLATMQETPLADTAPRDDQIEWLDDDTVLYGVDEEIWSQPADGSGAPQRWLAEATSPAVVRR
jgi:hypothetical protein